MLIASLECLQDWLINGSVNNCTAGMGSVIGVGTGFHATEGKAEKVSTRKLARKN